MTDSKGELSYQPNGFPYCQNDSFFGLVATPKKGTIGNGFTHVLPIVV